MKKHIESTRKFIVESKLPLGFVVFLGLGLLAFYLISREYRPTVATLVTLAAIAGAAGLTVVILKFFQSVLTESLPRVWKNIMNGLSAFVAAAGYCCLGVLLGYSWATGRYDHLLWLTTFAAVILFAAFRSGYKSVPPGH